MLQKTKENFILESLTITGQCFKHPKTHFDTSANEKGAQRKCKYKPKCLTQVALLLEHQGPWKGEVADAKSQV